MWYPLLELDERKILLSYTTAPESTLVPSLLGKPSPRLC